MRATASPTTRTAVEEQDGARPKVSASLFTGISIDKSQQIASDELWLRVNETRKIFHFFRLGSVANSSAVSPLLDIKITTSSLVTMPRSP